METPLMKIDEELREAAVTGDVEFLKKCVASNKSKDYYLTVFPRRHDGDLYWGNIFHIAARVQNEEFIRNAIELLGAEVVNQLLCQPRSENKYNPLHVAARVGNVDIVKMFVNAFKSSPSDVPNITPPWLLPDEDGDTPCHVALFRDKEDCGLEILKNDKVLLSDMVNHDGDSLLYSAVLGGLDKVAMEILMGSEHSFSASYALHCVPSLPSEEGKDICKLLLQKKPNLIMQKDKYGVSMFEEWAQVGYIWPFECFLNSNDIIPNTSKVSADLIATTDDEGRNPLHTLSDIARGQPKRERIKIGKLLIDTYRQQADAQVSSSIPTELQVPWLVPDNQGKTPLDYAITEGYEEFAKLILLEDENALKTCADDILFKAIEKKFQEVPQKILQIVDEKGFTHFLTNKGRVNVMHLAPKCNNEEFFELLLKRHPEFLERVDKSGNSVLHSWVKIGQVWPFEYLLNQGKNIDHKSRTTLVDLIGDVNAMEENPFHVAASQTYAAAQQVVKLLAEASLEEYSFLYYNKYLVPWCRTNRGGEGALHLAIRCQPEENIALHLLSLHQHEPLEELLDFYQPEEHKILFLAVENNFYEVVKTILTRLNKSSWTKYLKDSSNKQNLLHLASACTDEELGKWLVEKVSDLITEPDARGITPLEQASDNGAAWIIETMLQNDPSAFNEAPLAWVKACEKGHVSVVRVFIKYCPKMFSDHCIHHQDSPLHHIELPNIVAYKEFINIRHIKDLINTQDSEGATPLHKAIEKQNILLAEALLNMDNIRYNVKNKDGKTARGMLAHVCKRNPQWDQMCKSIGFDPNLKTSYFQRKTDLLEVRNTLSVVAALLATITFTAGFTLPGGFDQNNGEAILADKAAFLVFLISDTLAMCFSMLVLICLIWSMIFEPNQSLFLIDRSVGLIRVALYLTLLAFVTGVYIVISPKSLWAAILIIVICSLVGIISANRALLYNALSVVQNLISFADEESRDEISLMELGIPLLERGESSNQACPSTS